MFNGAHYKVSGSDDQAGLTIRIKKVDRTLTKLSDKLEIAYGKQEAKNIEIINRLYDDLDAINDELEGLEPIVEIKGVTAEDKKTIAVFGKKGDFDVDGDVDGKDLSEFSANFGR